jgi:hypothetical protein
MVVSGLFYLYSRAHMRHNGISMAPMDRTYLLLNLELSMIKALGSLLGPLLVLS